MHLNALQLFSHQAFAGDSAIGLGSWCSWFWTSSVATLTKLGNFEMRYTPHPWRMGSAQDSGFVVRIITHLRPWMAGVGIKTRGPYRGGFPRFAMVKHWTESRDDPSSRVPGWFLAPHLWRVPRLEDEDLSFLGVRLPDTVSGRVSWRIIPGLVRGE